LDDSTLEFQQDIKVAFSELASSNRLMAETDKKRFCSEAGQKYLEAYDKYTEETNLVRKNILKKILDVAERTFESSQI
jgi:hypothetical protein